MLPCESQAGNLAGVTLGAPILERFAATADDLMRELEIATPARFNAASRAAKSVRAVQRVETAMVQHVNALAPARAYCRCEDVDDCGCVPMGADFLEQVVDDFARNDQDRHRGHDLLLEWEAWKFSRGEALTEQVRIKAQDGRVFLAYRHACHARRMMAGVRAAETVAEAARREQAKVDGRAWAPPLAAPKPRPEPSTGPPGRFVAASPHVTNGPPSWRAGVAA